MKTLKVTDGDLVFSENGELEMVEGDAEIAQGVGMSLAIRKEEFKLDEFIGMDRSFLGQKRVTDEEVADAVLGALQIMTDQEVIAGADDIKLTKTGRSAAISLSVIKGDGESLSVKGVELDGS